jgi:hypothetical protein
MLLADDALLSNSKPNFSRNWDYHNGKVPTEDTSNITLQMRRNEHVSRVKRLGIDIHQLFGAILHVFVICTSTDSRGDDSSRAVAFQYTMEKEFVV